MTKALISFETMSIYNKSQNGCGLICPVVIQVKITGNFLRLPFTHNYQQKSFCLYSVRTIKTIHFKR